MNPEVALTIAAEDPVAVALNDPNIRLRMENAACAMLAHKSGISSLQRREEARAFVQEAAMRAWARRAQYDPTKEIASWLVGFINNVIREYRTKCRRDVMNQAHGVDGLDQCAIEPSHAPGDIFADRQLALSLLDRLPPREQMIIRLKECEQMTCAEIGQQIGMKENAVRTAAFRALQTLRKQSAGEGRP